MAYLPSNAPIGPNSLQPPAACEVAGSDARILEAQLWAAKGRFDTYTTVPPTSSFDSPTLAVDAARILAQSRDGRASVLAASSPEPNQHIERTDLRQLIADAPEVVSLNGRPDYCGGVIVRPQPPEMVMPSPAPIPTHFDAYRGTVAFVTAPKPTEYASFSPPDEGVYMGPVIAAGSVPEPIWSPVSMGPGGPAASDWSHPEAGLRFETGPTQYYGYAGYAPPWGDANLVDVSNLPEVSTGGWFKGLLILGGLVILGGAAAGTKARKRRYGRK